MKFINNIFKYYMKYLQLNGIYVIISLKRKTKDKSKTFIDHYFTVFITNMWFFIILYIFWTEIIIRIDLYEKKSLFDIFIIILFSLICICIYILFFIKYFRRNNILKLYKEKISVKHPLLKAAILGTIPIYILLFYILFLFR